MQVKNNWVLKSLVESQFFAGGILMALAVDEWSENRDFAQLADQSLGIFEREIRQRVPFDAGRPDPEALHDVLAQWHRDYATESDPSLPASYFEGLRRNVLLAYYTSPAGWALVGYPGPVHTSPTAMDASLG